MDSIYIDLKQENKWIREQFQFADLISLEDFLGKFEELIFEIEHLKEIIEEMEKEEDDEWICVD